MSAGAVGRSRCWSLGYYDAAGECITDRMQVRNRGPSRLFWLAHAPRAAHRSSLAARRCLLPARRRPRAQRGRRTPWATVNVCDTHDAPERDRDPRRDGGTGAQDRACTCASACSSSTATGAGRRLKSGRLTDSGWVRVASAGKGGEHDAGWSFEFKPPAVRRRARAARRRVVRVAARRQGARRATKRVHRGRSSRHGRRRARRLQRRRPARSPSRRRTAAGRS